MALAIASSPSSEAQTVNQLIDPVTRVYPLAKLVNRVFSGPPLRYSPQAHCLRGQRFFSGIRLPGTAPASRPRAYCKFAACLAWGLVEELCEKSGSQVGSDDLTDLMRINIWMNQSGAELCDSLQAMLRLRTAIVHRRRWTRTEPVPLLPADPKVAAVNLARYLEDLLRRASYSGDLATQDVADRALELFVA